MMTISQIKMFAKRQLKGNLLSAIGAMILITMCTMLWSTVISAALVMGLIIPMRGRVSIPMIGDDLRLRLIYFTIAGIIIAALIFLAVYIFTGLMLGSQMMYLNIARGRKVSPFDVFKGFKRGFHLKNYLSVLLILYLIEFVLMIPETFVALRSGYNSGDYRVTSFITSIVVFVVMLFLSFSSFASADNPHMKPMDAIKVSARLMRNRKMKLIVMELSFFLWLLLCFLTCGLAVFWVIPYFETSLTIFYLSAYGEDYQSRIKEGEYKNAATGKASEAHHDNAGDRETGLQNESEKMAESVDGVSGESGEAEPRDIYVKGDATPESETDEAREQNIKRSFEEVRSQYTDLKDGEAAASGTEEAKFPGHEEIKNDDSQESATGTSEAADSLGTFENEESNPDGNKEGNAALDPGTTTTVRTDGNEDVPKTAPEEKAVDSSEIKGAGDSEEKTSFKTEEDAFAAYEKWKKDHGITIENPDPFHERYKKS